MSILKSNADIAKSLEKLTGRNYEECLRDKAGLTNILGNLDIKEFARVAQSKGASESSVISEISSLTGMDYESTLMELKKPSLGRLDSGLRMPGLPSWHPLNK